MISCIGGGGILDDVTTEFPTDVVRAVAERDKIE